MKPTPTPEMIDAFIIAKESADRRLYGFHNLGRHFILDGTTEVWFTASDDYEVGHAVMMAQLEHLRVEAALSAALSVQPAAAVVGEPVAWISEHKHEVGRFWLSEPNGRGDAYWSDAFPVYRAAPSAPDGWQPEGVLKFGFDRISEEITAGRKQNALTYLSCAFAEAASLLSQQDSELERLRREVAELREISVDKACAWDSLNATFERGRRKGLSEAAGIAELDADWSAFGKKDIEPWDTGPDAVRDYSLGIVAGRAIASAIRAKAEETRT